MIMYEYIILMLININYDSYQINIFRTVFILFDNYSLVVFLMCLQACPLNYNIGSEMTDNQDWKDFSELFAPAIKSVVDFAKLIPGFMLLNQDDQVVLLKVSLFVLFVNLSQRKALVSCSLQRSSLSSTLQSWFQASCY